MRALPSKVSAKPLALALGRHKFETDGTGILMLNGQWKEAPWFLRSLTRDAVQELETITGLRSRYLMVNIIPPGIKSPSHRDPEPIDPRTGQFLRFQRYHLPLRTNPDAWFHSEKWSGHMAPGFWHGPIRYWEPHSVGNDGAEPRMHLVVDLA